MNKTVGVTRKRKKRRGLVPLQLAIVVGFLALAWFSFGQNVLSPRTQLSVPDRLGTLELIGSIEGSEAMAQVRALHGTDIDLVTAYIAEYAQSDERVTAWVGKAGDGDAAAELLRRMIEGIEIGGSGFGDLQRLTIAGHYVFQVEGPGGKHFFYSSGEQGEKVVWLTIEAEDALPHVEQAVKTF